VRKAIAITAVFSGLRMIECMNLELEKINRRPEGYAITLSKAKQRSDKMNTKFLVPQEGASQTFWLSIWRR
jgi:site-specific recombinase XerD